ncbi:formimidoylglutamase [Sporosarcina sp. ANT_H38]|uniref:formimidoylglutamase n=1 Tax=Sporosarcina sp. ANT_H38 TaxID=2597358 RepID=UPI0011F24CC5|nr:formimidoylglutamase [Sporosarcina sp. ANT_H38]KAA0955767.1 formimidoylglutamase [Sporosarcina sp. ANT_H38]
MKKVSSTIWSGRTDHIENRTSFRYHQVVAVSALKDLAPSPDTIAIIGFESEEGVRRNSGRLGAAKAPDALRGELAKMPWKFPDTKRLVDIGNIECHGRELEQSQQQLGNAVAEALHKKMTPIILGGGHETAYGHYLGVRKSIGDHATLGIINIDAHFDLRTYDEQPSSGTMFKQILDQDEHSSYFVAGIQRYGNTQELFDRANELGVIFEYEENMHIGNLDKLTLDLNQFISQHDFVFLTLCTDVLNATFAPGVSAPSPFGLDPSVVRSIIRTVISHDKTLSFDISEVNPSLDENNRTVKLGAHLTNEAIASFLGRT